jgi:(E)-4-hydroxy-3-methylbut-2-enyl-diphosphate synthase
MRRKKTRAVTLGALTIGGGAPISVQSMTKTDTRNVPATVQQILELEQAGCEIIRSAVLDQEAAEALGIIRKQIHIPLVADIHFDYRLALTAIEAGVDGLRLNPGNIGSEAGVQKVALAARSAGIPIRIGVNSGSIEKDLLQKHGKPNAKAMLESALRHVALLEKHGFEDIVLSLKAADVLTTVEAYRLAASRTDYPLHVGVTEAGPYASGTVKSAVGIGTLLYLGIGDTIRVSLTGNPLEEVRVGWDILTSLGLRSRGPDIISCPTCGRCQIDVQSIVEKVAESIRTVKTPLRIAVMGCVVNGPGEAREADVGIAGGRGSGVLFSKGEIIRKVADDELCDALLAEIFRLAETDGDELSK